MTYEAISRFGSRIAGSPAERKTLEYAEATLRSIGATEFRREPFEVTVPNPEAKARLTIGPSSVELFPLWPNRVRTSSCDVSGPLVYGGRGTLSELDGKAIRGSIVVLEFDSGERWHNAAKLGAKAIVFIEPSFASRGEAEQKFSNVPLSEPRFYLPLDHAGPVLQAAERREVGRVTCRQNWVVRHTYNLVAELPSNAARAIQEKIVLFASADGMSVVPGVAPSAESIGGLATMLELARVWSHRIRARPLEFVVSSAHFISLQGAREFVERRLDAPAAPIDLVLTLDISSGGRSLGSYGRGWYLEYRDESQQPLQAVSRALRSHAALLAPIVGAAEPRMVLTDAVNQGDGRTWKNNIPGKFALDCEPMVNAQLNALTLVTIEDSRSSVDTPQDTLGHIRFSNVRVQAQIAAALLWDVLNDTSDPNYVGDYKLPIEPSAPSRMTLTGGFATIEGQVAVFDPERSFVPDVPVPNTLAYLASRQKTAIGVRCPMIQMATGADAKYRFIGIPPTTSFPEQQYMKVQLAAYRVDPTTGAVDYAEDEGILGDLAYPNRIAVKTSYKSTPIIVFPCVSIDFYDLVDPEDLKVFEDGEEIDADTNTQPRSFGYAFASNDFRMSSEVDDTTVFFFSAGQRFRMLMGNMLGEMRLLLVNATAKDAEGRGYRAPGATGPAHNPEETLTETGLMPDLALNAALDMITINGVRIAKFSKYRIVSPGLLKLQAQALEEIRLAQKAKTELKWSEEDLHARAAWGYALRAHPVLMKTASDVVNGVLFYLFLIIPFSYFVERLFFGARALSRQLLVSSAVFILSFLGLRLIHPAFEIVTNPFMIFIAFVMGSLSVVVIAFILGKFEASLKSLKQAESGLHEVDIRRMSVAMAAFNLGVSNMRRRKARTFLTTLTLVVMTFIVLSFTSIVSELQFTEMPSSTIPRYTGLLVRNPGYEPLQSTTYTQLANEFSTDGVVSRRTWYYGADIGDLGVLTLSRTNHTAVTRAMVGFDPSEAKIARVQEALLPGGRWFQPGDRQAIILPTPIAIALKVDAADVGKATVNFSGVEYTVIGIVDPTQLRSIVDMDGDNILPADFTLSQKLQEGMASGNRAFRNFVRLDPAVCFFVPSETAIHLGADIRSVAVGFQSPVETRRALTSLMPRLRLNLYAGVANDAGTLEVRQFSAFESAKGAGIGLVVVQLIIAAVFVLNTMVATVFERTKEISIFSSIGLAPNHIAMLFFAESLVYAILGSVIGYFVAQILARIIIVTGALPGLYLNFSSTSAVMSAAFVVLVVVGSTIYPARMAAKIAAPAMSDDMLQAEPEGDEWSLQLPFSVGSEEAPPLVEFLGEWLRAYEQYTIGEFVTDGTKIYSESNDYVVATTAWLAPYDLGVSQRLTLRAGPSAVEGVHALDLSIERISGEHENWVNVNRRFLAALRKQFLTWRTLTSEQRARYGERAVESFLVRPSAPVLD